MSLNQERSHSPRGQWLSQWVTTGKEHSKLVIQSSQPSHSTRYQSLFDGCHQCTSKPLKPIKLSIRWRAKLLAVLVIILTPSRGEKIDNQVYSHISSFTENPVADTRNKRPTSVIYYQMSRTKIDRSLINPCSRSAKKNASLIYHNRHGNHIYSAQVLQ